MKLIKEMQGSDRLTLERKETSAQGGSGHCLCYGALWLLALAESSVHFVGHPGCRMKRNLAK